MTELEFVKKYADDKALFIRDIYGEENSAIERLCGGERVKRFDDIVDKRLFVISVLYDFVYKSHQNIVLSSNNPVEFTTLSKIIIEEFEKLSKQLPTVLKVKSNGGKKVKRLKLENWNELSWFVFTDACTLKGYTPNTYYFDGYLNSIEPVKQEFNDVLPAIRGNVILTRNKL